MFTNTLSKKAQNTLAILGKGRCLPRKTYLAGGSALALHFGHRISVDFDFFTTTDFDPKKIAENLTKKGSFETQQISKETLLGFFDKTRFSLFYYDYPLLSKTLPFLGINIADVADIAAMKLSAIMDRGTKKDFIDLFFITKKGMSLEKCFQYYDRKYQALANNIYSIITSISYFTDAENSEMPQMRKKLSWEKVKKFFEKEAVRLGKKYL